MKNKDFIELDSIDMQILNILQIDSTTPIQTIANQIGLTNNPCWRRIKRLQKTGVIKRSAAIINRELLGLGTTAFVTLRIENHTIDWLNNFSECISELPEIIECHRMTGDIDYLLKIAIKDLNHYDSVYRKLISSVPDLTDVSSTFSIEQLKTNEIIDVKTMC